MQRTPWDLEKGGTFQNSNIIGKMRNQRDEQVEEIPSFFFNFPFASFKNQNKSSQGNVVAEVTCFAKKK